MVLFDGISFGGFNLVDLDGLHRTLRLPVVAATRRRTGLPENRGRPAQILPPKLCAPVARVRAHRLFRVPTGGEPTWAAAAGCTRREAQEILRRSTVRGFVPEPLRVAALVARAASPASPARSSGPGPLPQAHPRSTESLIRTSSLPLVGL